MLSRNFQEILWGMLNYMKRLYMHPGLWSKGVKLKVLGSTKEDFYLNLKTLRASRLSKERVCNISGLSKNIKLKL